MTRNLYLGLTALMLSAVGCEGIYSGEDIKGKDMSVEASVQVFADGQQRQWEDGDRIGVSVEGMADYGVETNIAFDWNAETRSFDAVKSGIVLKGASRTLVAYYPFDGAENEVPSEKVISTDASMQNEAGHAANDHLFAKTSATREDPVASFEFAHVMSMMKIVFVTDDGSSDDLEYTLSGLVLKGRFDPYTGQIMTLDNARTEPLSMVASGMSSSLMLVPQSADLTISLIYKGKTYATTFEVALESDKVHEYTARIGVETLDASLTVTHGGTADWVVGEEEDITSEEIEVSVNATGVKDTKAVTDSGFRTHFEEGDVVGVYAVKDGSVLPNVNNVPMTFDGTEWKPESKLNYNASMQGAVFYAYYPYDENSAFDVSSADPFSSKVASWRTPYDISDAEDYEKTDLMTSSAQVEEVNGKFTVTFDMVHSLAMVAIAFPKHAYTFTNKDPVLKPYVLSESTDIVMNAAIGSEPSVAIRPYLEPSSQTYRFLVKPGTPLTVSGTFTSAGKSRRFSVNLPDGVAAGSCRPYKIDGGYKGVEMELKIGDYYCADGSIVSYDPAVAAPSNAIGVIYMLGTTEQIETAHPSCTHALVYALERASGQAEKFGKVQNRDDWYSSLGLDKNDYKDSDYNGFGYTSCLLKYAGDDGMMENFQTSIAAYRNANILPAGFTTQWYLPSYNEYLLMAGNVTVLDASLKHVGGESVFEGTETGAKNKFKAYWTSTLRSGTAVCMYYDLWESDTNNNAVQQTGYVNSRDGFFRYAFAF
ncbi:MAG: hypothetical protein E7123_06275 [Bacteroidales bacterium]|nr:hypothetical protein [Bacteroidales bacterium]